MKLLPTYIFYFLILIFCFAVPSLPSQAQQSGFIHGVVVDSITGEPVSFASVQLENTTIGTATDIDGYFSMRYLSGSRKIIISSIGFETKTETLPERIGTGEIIRIRLNPSTIGLTEVVVSPDNPRYSRKNNPAVELMKQVIANKEQNRIKNIPGIEYEQYEKLTLYWDNFKLENRLLKKNFGFIENHLDTSIFTGKQVLTLSMREILRNVRADNISGGLKKNIVARRSEGVEETFNDGSMDVFLEQVFREVDIYDDNIEVLLNQFVSPTSSALATLYYKFFIQDTLTIDNIRCVNVAFFPFNPESYSFNGNLYIAIDNHFAIKRVDLSIPRNLNINFLENLRVIQHFNLQENGLWTKEKEDVYTNFAMSNFLTKVYAHQVRSYRYIENGEMVYPEKTDEAFWQDHRHVALKRVESDLPKLMDELQDVPMYRRFEKFLEIIITGYIKTSNERQSKSKIDIGQVWTFYGSNPVEGHRLRLGAMTTAHFHSRIFLSGYGAYGFKDQKWKYSATAGYSFVKKQNYWQEFPRNDLSFTTEYDLYSLGMQMNDALKDNLFVALGTAGISNRSYQHRYKLAYTVDWMSGLGVSAWWKHTKDTPAGALEYRLQVNENELIDIPGFTLSKVGGEISFAPGMQDYGANRGGRNAKINFINDNIQLKLMHEYAYRGFLGGDYAYHQSQATVSDRIWLSSFGHIDGYVSAGKVWNQVPFPMLASPEVNPSVFMEKNRFHLIQPFEFVSDEYIALHTSYFLKGWILNRIPLIKKLQLREVVTFSGYYGNLTDKNNPAKTHGLFVFPQSAHPLHGDVYVEGSVGVENIFKVFRVDYFRRFTHLDLPGAKKQGLKIGFRFAF
ncbi:DUF5686 and carboxypeptidase-like regulatory domain-containing protein [Proteiniphilum sp. X52]|uniref:DUF5686 and carboxypeptidase-like regulatory domain-containing protein n=1 Tax=Proteiniphilum sp. X52 TaxID=2382159 RepID=UPI001314F79C|nr:DUF5686 and carboxypeptidase-like regulatory domain-containing protein [Proteiniphilum sp. X52]